MKLLYQEEEHIKLLTQIRRSYGALGRRLNMEDWVETKLFKFKEEDEKEYNKQRRSPRRLTALFSVIVKATGKKYLVTREFSFGHDKWSLYQKE